MFYSIPFILQTFIVVLSVLACASAGLLPHAPSHEYLVPHETYAAPVHAPAQIIEAPVPAALYSAPAPTQLYSAPAPIYHHAAPAPIYHHAAPAPQVYEHHLAPIAAPAPAPQIIHVQSPPQVFLLASFLEISILNIICDQRRFIGIYSIEGNQIDFRSLDAFRALIAFPYQIFSNSTIIFMTIESMKITTKLQ